MDVMETGEGARLCRIDVHVVRREGEEDQEEEKETWNA